MNIFFLQKIKKPLILQFVKEKVKNKQKTSMIYENKRKQIGKNEFKKAGKL